MDTILNKIRDANLKRKVGNMDRRILKIGEEFGEACQAYLSVTSKNNDKKKTWDDVREELTDVLIVTLDVLLTEMPDEANADIEARLHKELDRKLAKWDKKSKNQKVPDDAE